MGIIDGIIGGAASLGTSLLNMRFQGEQNQITRDREDNAVQRRVADLKAAGLNPVLAAGDPAAASNQPAMRLGDPVEAGYQAMHTSQDISTSAAEKVRIEEQTKQVKAATRIAKAEADMKEYDRDVQRAAGDPGEAPVSSVVVTPSGSWDQAGAIRSAKAELAAKAAQPGVIQLRNLLTEAQTAETAAAGGLKQVDLDTLKQLGGGTAANAGLALILKLLSLVK